MQDLIFLLLYIQDLVWTNFEKLEIGIPLRANNMTQ